MLKLGYKASAEQFAPGELLDFAVPAETGRLRFGLRQRPFPALEAYRRPCARTRSPGWARWARAPRSVVIGTSVLTPTFRYHPSIVAQAFGTLGAMFPGRVILGIGTGESLNEVPVDRPALARVQGALRPAARGGDPDPHAVERGAGQLRGRVLQDRESHDLRPARRSQVPIYVAAAGALVAKYAGRSGDGFICTSGKKRELYTETLLPNVAEGIAAASRAEDAAYDRMIEMKVSFDTDRDARAGGHAALGGAGADAGGEDVGRGPAGDGAAGRRAAGRARGQPLDRVERSGRACRADQAYVDLGFRHLVFHAPGPDQARFLKLYGEQVLPRLRKRFG